LAIARASERSGKLAFAAFFLQSRRTLTGITEKSRIWRRFPSVSRSAWNSAKTPESAFTSHASVAWTGRPLDRRLAIGRASERSGKLAFAAFFLQSRRTLAGITEKSRVWQRFPSVSRSAWNSAKTPESAFTPSRQRGADWPSAGSPIGNRPGLRT
jgi:hypothetical protein